MRLKNKIFIQYILSHIIIRKFLTLKEAPIMSTLSYREVAPP